MTLYHWTSPTGAARIAADGGLVRPSVDVITRWAPHRLDVLRPHHRFCWFIDLPEAPQPGMLALPAHWWVARVPVPVGPDR